MLQRGSTSTRWRDLLDVAILSDRFEFGAGDVKEASMQVAAHRGVELGPPSPDGRLWFDRAGKMGCLAEEPATRPMTKSKPWTLARTTTSPSHSARTNYSR